MSNQGERELQAENRRLNRMLNDEEQRELAGNRTFVVDWDQNPGHTRGKPNEQQDRLFAFTPVDSKSKKYRYAYQGVNPNIYGIEQTEAVFLLADGVSQGKRRDATGILVTGGTAADIALDVIDHEGITRPDKIQPAMFAANKVLYANNLKYNPSRLLEKNITTTLLVAMLTKVAIAGSNSLEYHLYLDSIGDTRAYGFRQDTLFPLTQDDTDPQRRREGLTQSIGFKSEIHIQDNNHRMEILMPGDLLLFCTDGIYKPLGDTTMADMLRLQPNPGMIKTLITTAVNKENQYDYHDNVSGIVVKVQR